VPLEAMACGTPVITTAVGAGPDILKEIPIFVVNVQDNNIENKILERISGIEKEYDSLSTQARDYVLKHHNYDDWKNKWLNVINHVINR
jgi:glycosyltransferase involved in cell wall biosynthesis